LIERPFFHHRHAFCQTAGRTPRSGSGRPSASPGVDIRLFGRQLNAHGGPERAPWAAHVQLSSLVELNCLGCRHRSAVVNGAGTPLLAFNFMRAKLFCRNGPRGSPALWQAARLGGSALRSPHPLSANPSKGALARGALRYEARRAVGAPCSALKYPVSLNPFEWQLTFEGPEKP
jgi:hypothetical protein